MRKPTDIQAVLFDFDGTLADTETEYFKVDGETFEKFGTGPISEEDLHTLIGTDGRESFTALLAKYGRPDVTYEQFTAGRHDTVASIYRTRPLQLEPGARELLDDLYDRGVKMALVSTTDAYNVVYGANRLGITKYFDAIVTGDMLEKRKPWPDPYLLGLEFLGVEADHAVAVEDSLIGIEAAHAAGLWTVGYAGSVLNQDCSTADLVVKRFSDLTL
jgi:HAD superfamily hydrolase (TIGR01509 family)